MSGQAKSTTTQQNTESKGKSSSKSGPIDQMVPLYRDLFSRTQGALDATNNKPYGGDFIAAPSQLQREGVASIAAAAPGLATGSDELRAMATRIAGGEFLDPNNPILTSAIAATIDPLRRELNETWLPQVSDAAIAGGAYGGSANALLKSAARDRFDQNAMNTGANMTLDWTNARFNDLALAPGMFDSANRLALAPGTALGMAGDVEHNLDQMIINNELAKYDNSLNAPWFGLDKASALYNAPGWGTNKGTTQSQSSTTSTVTPPTPDLSTQLLQGGIGGLAMLGSLGTMFAPAAIGGAGGIGGAFTNIFGGLGGLMGTPQVAPTNPHQIY